MSVTRQKALIAGVGGSGSEIVRMLRRDWDLVALDVDGAALANLSAVGAPERSGALETREGDATSALVLERAGARGVQIALLCTGSDEANVEVGRVLADRFGVRRRIAVSCRPSSEAAYLAAGIEIVSRSHASAIAASALVQQGHKVARDVGLGVGEILEVEVLPNSPVVRKPLKELHPRRWLVGAVYRDKELIIPHGETLLAAGDRVLIIGDAAILPDIATLIRSGDSEFPLQYGSHLVALCEPGIEKAAEEIAYLLGNTKAERLEMTACRKDECRAGAISEELSRRGIAVSASCEASDDIDDLIRLGAQKGVGVFVRPPEPIPFLTKLGIGRTQTGRILELLDSPLLMARGTFPYKRVLLALAELPFPNAAAQLAVDVVRMLGDQLHLGVVHQPDIVVGPGRKEATAARQEEVVKIAALYDVPTTILELDGNPVHAVTRASRDFDLVIAPYRKGRRSSLIRPNIALGIVHSARCSAMAMPH